MTYRLRQFNLKSVVKRGKFFEIRYTNPRTQKREYYKLGITHDEVKRNLPEFNRMYAGLKRQVFSYRITVSQGVQSWLEQKRTELSNKKTVVRYEEIMNNFAEFLKDKFPALGYMDELAQKHFEEFKEYRKNIKGKKERTVNFELDMLSNLFKRLMEKDYLNYNPLSKVKRLQEPYKEERWFTEEEIRKIFEIAKSEKTKINWYVIFATYYYTGMRKRELMSLRKKDIDFDKGIILIRHKEGFKPKTDRPRAIPIHPELVSILRLLRPFGPRNDTGDSVCNDEGKVVSCNNQGDGDFVFVNSRGKPFSNDAIRQKLKKLCRKAEIKPGKLHSFRHTWTAHSIMKGCPSDVVQAIGGWKEKDMIERYKHLAPDYMADIYKKTIFLGSQAEDKGSLKAQD
ncbi:MAG: site-specific integrase [Candidatus Omnitrophota bacterium]|nr:site-specific integrase [Candidatus Omnitrophota bacterium]